MSKKEIVSRIASLKVTSFLLVISMILLVYGTLIQEQTGIIAVQKQIFHSFFLYITLPYLEWKLPIFPGGMLVAILFVMNLLASFYRFSLSKIGVFIIHTALLVFIIGGFFTLFSKESILVLKEGEKINFSQSIGQFELSIRDNKGGERVFSDLELRDRKVLFDEALPFSLHIANYFPHALCDEQKRIKYARSPQNENLMTPALFVETKQQGVSTSSSVLHSSTDYETTIQVGENIYQLSLRNKRLYLPFFIGLDKFTHKVHPKTKKSSFFSSKVVLSGLDGGFLRGKTITINHPLRIRNKSFYQLGFSDSNTVSIIHVVENSARWLPYIACSLIAFGLIWQSILQMMKSKV